MRLDDVVNVNKRNCGSRDHKPNTDVAPKYILSLHLPSGTIVELYILEFAFHVPRLRIHSVPLAFSSSWNVCLTLNRKGNESAQRY